MWTKKQRVVSHSEPELGLGIITSTQGDQQVEVLFPQSQEKRTYNLSRQNPLRRFQLDIGDLAQIGKGQSFSVKKIETKNFLIQYFGESESAWEWELEGHTQSQNALQALLSGSLSHHRTFDLRRTAQKIKSTKLSCGVSGLVGPRVSTLPHQMYVAHKVSRMAKPRVLLTDEVGLGKTIEAGLIFSALKSMNRADRVLFLVPDSLKHQWMAEMYRRFNELVTVIDEDRCLDEESSQPGSVFEGTQKALCSLQFLAEEPERLQQAIDSHWDLIVVDEAHHLNFLGSATQKQNWETVKKLSHATSGLLLLTATPKMHGLETQFGLLNLIDEAMYPRLEEYEQEDFQLRTLAALAQDIQDGAKAETSMQEIADKILKIYPNDQDLQEKLKPEGFDPDQVIDALIDRHGPGRVLFRNRRDRIQGFPKRILHSVPLDDAKLETRVRYLETLLHAHPQEKVLLLCTSQQQVQNLSRALEKQTDLKCAVFHEGLSLVDRDRQAALFAQSEDTQLLICSEIGGEGRNFQFCKKLILFDLPTHPDLIEQRIGRLDRIGQGAKIEIYALWQKGSSDELMFRWYHEGLGSFESSWNGCATIFAQFEAELGKLTEDIDNGQTIASLETSIDDLIARTKIAAMELKKRNAEGVDLLVDLNSFDAQQGEMLAELVASRDDDTEIEFFIKDLFDHFGVEYHDFDDQGTLLVESEALSFIEDFPAISSSENTPLAFDRDVALKREDVTFLSQDHYILDECLNFLIDRNEGASCICKWPDSPYGSGALIEVSLIIEPIGPRELELG